MARHLKNYLVGLALLEGNGCHNPAGTPAGGQFCGKNQGGTGGRGMPTSRISSAPMTKVARAVDGAWDDRSGADLIGLPTDVPAGGGARMQTHSIASIQALARGYMEQAGLPYEPPTTYAKVDKARAVRIAAEFDRMEDAPTDPKVKAAYEAMARETVAQYDYIVEHSGVKFEFSTPETMEYMALPRKAQADVLLNNHMYVFPTDDGFGSSGLDVSRNPLLADSGRKFGNRPALVNDIFRAVHDYFGHFKEGVGFRADGEENAWRSHSAMYSPLARRAMTTETRGQNSWVNFGPHGETNRTAGPADTVYADQKVGLLPQWVVEEGAISEGRGPVSILATFLRVAEKANNDCHNPAGSSTGGQFCSNGGAGANGAIDPDYRNLGKFGDGGAFEPEFSGRVGKGGKRHSRDVASDDAAMAQLDPSKGADNIVEVARSLLAEFGETAWRRAAAWYRIRQREQARFAGKVGIAQRQVCGAVASLSPQTDWDTNWKAAQAVCKLVATNPAAVVTKEYADSLWEHTKGYKNDASRIDIRHMVGQELRFNDLPAATAARIWPTIPRGSYGFSNMEKAIRCARGEDPDLVLGGNKVRSFFNNMNDPNDPRFITVDTHAVRMQTNNPMLRAAKPGAPATVLNRFFGNQRLYSLGVAAWGQAAKRVDPRMVPSEFQAATWILWRRRMERDAVYKKMEAEEKAEHLRAMKERPFEYGISEAVRHFVRRSRAVRRLAEHRGGTGGPARLHPDWSFIDTPRLEPHPPSGRGRQSPGDFFDIGRRLVEMARASGGTASSRRGRRLNGPPPPIAPGPRSTRRAFVRVAGGAVPSPLVRPRHPRRAIFTGALNG